MFMNDVLKQQECKNEAATDLRKLGIKCRPKKNKQHTSKNDNKIFGVPLGVLPTLTVTLSTGQQMIVPEVVHELCSFILNKTETEGIFRKEGSKARQNEIKALLRSGFHLQEDQHHVIDVAVVLKMFLRELPEPLIPYGYHELFLRCILIDGNQVDATLLACLLLPMEHLNTLSYLMQFFYYVTEFSKFNKMNSYNLAVVMSPNILPMDEKLCPNLRLRTTKTCEIVKLLIENSTRIGVIPDDIIRRMGDSGNVQEKIVDRKKKRRSGSLTRMFSGLKKIVGGKSTEENPTTVTPDLLITPINSMKKRRVQMNGLSNKKKKELMNKLPESTLLSTPFTPHRTPVCMDLSGDKSRVEKIKNEAAKEKKSQWFLRSKSVKNLKQENEITDKKESSRSKNVVERRWSAIGQATNLKKTKKRNSCAASLSHCKVTTSTEIKIEDPPEPDYIRVPKTEYEAIKNRVSAMERRISMEFESVQSRIDNENDNNTNMEVDNNIKNVQTVYEQTLEQTGQLSPTTDQLARRLSKELKIRRSGEPRMIRSPSARKIGSMRRKSREVEKNNTRLSRHQSWHVSRESTSRASLRRVTPDIILNSLPSKPVEQVMNDVVLENKEITKTRSSFGGRSSIKKGQVSCNLSGSSGDAWVSGEGFFGNVNSNTDESSNVSNDRASLAKLRSQNAGMVLAKAKLFDQLKDLNSPKAISLTRSIPKVRTNKIGSTRNIENRLSYRVRTLRKEDRRVIKKSISPRRRNGQLSHKAKLQIAKQYADSSAERSNSDKENKPENSTSFEKTPTLPLKDCNRINGQGIPSPMYSTPRATPQIKRSLHTKSPKRLCRTPVGMERGTPLRVLRRPTYHQV